MSILADESVDFAIVKRLRNEGWNVLFVTEVKSGIADSEVLDFAFKNNLLLLTEDKDFGELAYRLKYNHKGICLLRLSAIPRQQRIEMVSKIFSLYFEKMINSFSVLTERSLRIKP
ncbi:MAG TPA: DUF5615 family PIN-like protein [Ignavibacteriales bacterium]|nr:DUF5615 family PIN-like protein [Ignavibacteriales bacterium]